MARFQKSILRCGTYKSLDGEVRVTPARLRHWVSEFKRFSKSGNVAPVSFDHDEERLTALSLDEFRSAKDTVGRLTDLALSPDGKSAVATLDIHDQRAADKASGNHVFISPVLASEWRDGKGSRFRDIWSHVDIVNHPVDNTQGPFIAMSGQRKPLKHWRFSLMADEVLDDELDYESVNAMDDVAGTEVEAVDLEVPSEFSAPLDTNVDEILAELGQIGVLLGEDTDDSNFMDRLLPALKTFIAQKNKMDSMDDELGEYDAEPMEMETQEFQQMSMGAQNLFRDGQAKHQKAVKQKLAKLLNEGRCTPNEYRRMASRMGTVRLSLQTGKPRPNSLEYWIESRQSVPKGTFWTSKQRTQRMSLENRPKELTGNQMTQKEIDETANRILGIRK